MSDRRKQNSEAVRPIIASGKERIFSRDALLSHRHLLIEEGLDLIVHRGGPRTDSAHGLIVNSVVGHWHGHLPDVHLGE